MVWSENIYDNKNSPRLPMTVYSFACSTPDNWSSWHMWAKTFGPGIVTACVTGSIASAAYIVARTQREIAANKYDLDLFDKRYPLFEKINEVAEKIEKYDIRNEFVDENIQLLCSNEEVASRRNLYISYINKIRDFDISSIEGIYDEINKSARLYRNITPKKVGLLKKKIKELNENRNKTYTYQDGEYIFCDNDNNTLLWYIIFIQVGTIKFLRNDELKNYATRIYTYKEHIRNIEKEKDQNDDFEFVNRQQSIDHYREAVYLAGKELEEFIKNENYYARLYDELISFISESFNAMSEIRSCIIFFRDEMNRHLNVSEVSYQKKRTLYRTGL